MPENPPSFATVADHERPAALRLVFRRLAEPDREQQVAAFSGLAADGAAEVLGAYRKGALCAAALVQVQQGKSASLWPPQLVEGEPATTATALLAAIEARLNESKVRLAQCLLETDSQPEATLLREGGYRHATDLLYLACPSDQFPTTAPSLGLEFIPYSAQRHAEFLRLVEQTYIDTLDCPALNDARDTEDVLADYRATGAFDPARWLTVRHAARDVGCLILTEHVAYSTWELIYMGIVPAARGQGIGGRIARHAQWLTGQAHCTRLVLAVDAKNDPALRMYAAAGFRAWDRRAVFLKIRAKN